ncbi:hypothetical protein EE612_027877 [Oryza sativa]|nr:hypothetical protein EE612_027877 [Oryza sativa]
MARSLAAVLLLLVAAAGASHAASPAEMYWKIALPTSPMPGAIRDLISPASSVGSASKEDTVGNVFFLEKDLFPGSKMTLHFTRATAGAALLPAAAPSPSRSPPKGSRRSFPSSPSRPSRRPPTPCGPRSPSARPRGSPARRPSTSTTAPRRSSPWSSSSRPASAPATSTPCPRR